MRLRVAIGAALACGALAAPAEAVRTETAHMPASAPELAGDGAVFFSFTPGNLRVVHARPGAPPATVREFQLFGGVDDDECCSSSVRHAFSASATRVAVSEFREAFAKGFLAQSDYYLFAGPLGGELSRLFLCQFDHPYDVDGDRIAYLGDDCTERTGSGGGNSPRIVVRDLASDGAPTLATFPVTIPAGKVDLAGDHVAWSVNQGTGAGVYVRGFGGASGGYEVPGETGQWSLQADGKLAAAYPERLGGCRIDWHSKADPAAHRLDVCPLSRVVMAGDRIAFQRRDATSDSLDVVGLDGARRSVVFSEPANAFSGFDWDGTRLAYAVNGCLNADDRVYFEDLTSEPPLVEGGECPVTLGPKTVRATKSGLVRVNVAPADGAAGTLVLYRGKNQASTRPVPFEIAPGSKPVANRLNGAALKPMRERGSVVLQARAVVTQRSGSSRTYKRAIRVLPPKR